MESYTFRKNHDNWYCVVNSPTPAVNMLATSNRDARKKDKERRSEGGEGEGRRQQQQQDILLHSTLDCLFFCSTSCHWKRNDIKIYSNFFVQVHNITPLTLTLLVLAGQIVSVFSPFACLVLARSIGRPQTMVLIRLIEPGALVVFGWWNNYYACCIVFVLFLGIPIGTRSIEKALLNDYTNKKSRARWNALEAVNRSTWSGSAVLGGWLSGMKHPDGWKLLFTSSAGTVSAALVVLSLLLVGGDMVVR